MVVSSGNYNNLNVGFNATTYTGLGLITTYYLAPNFNNTLMTNVTVNTFGYIAQNFTYNYNSTNLTFETIVMVTYQASQQIAIVFFDPSGLSLTGNLFFTATINSTAVNCANAQCLFQTSNTTAIVPVVAFFQGIQVASQSVNFSTAIQNGTCGVIGVIVSQMIAFNVGCIGNYSILVLTTTIVSNLVCNVPFYRLFDNQTYTVISPNYASYTTPLTYKSIGFLYPFSQTLIPYVNLQMFTVQLGTYIPVCANIQSIVELNTSGYTS